VNFEYFDIKLALFKNGKILREEVFRLSFASTSLHFCSILLGRDIKDTATNKI
jgi:hypothetical protein